MKDIRKVRKFERKFKSLVHRPSSLRSPARGCGNPQLRPNPRLSSKSGESNGGGAPLVVGEGVQRGPPRNRSPLARLCLLSPRCERRSLPQERNRFRSNFRPRRSELSPKHPADSPFVSAICSHVPSPPAGRFLCRQRNRRKKPPKGTYPEGGSLWNPSPSARGLRPP